MISPIYVGTSFAIKINFEDDEASANDRFVALDL